MFKKAFIIKKRYKLVRFINSGGMGQVWKARDILLRRTVAIKIVLPHLIDSDSNLLKILKDEAKIGAKLIGHPNIVSILDFGSFIYEESKMYFIAMEYVRGQSLDSWISKYVNKLEETTFYNRTLTHFFQYRANNLIL